MAAHISVPLTDDVMALLRVYDFNSFEMRGTEAGGLDVLLHLTPRSSGPT